MYFRRLRDLREDHDMKQVDVASYLEIAQTVYSRYERGFQTIPVEHLISLLTYTMFQLIIFWEEQINNCTRKRHSDECLLLCNDYLYIESEQYNVAVFHDVFFAFTSD